MCWRMSNTQEMASQQRSVCWPAHRLPTHPGDHPDSDAVERDCDAQCKLDDQVMVWRGDNGRDRMVARAGSHNAWHPLEVLVVGGTIGEQ